MATDRDRIAELERQAEEMRSPPSLLMALFVVFLLVALTSWGFYAGYLEIRPL